MNKSTIITFLLGITAATALTYSFGFFGSNTSNVSVEVTQTPKQNIQPVVTSIPTNETTKTPVTPKVDTISTPSKTNAYTSTEVAKHAIKNDCWVVINNNIYNLTHYIVRHPGGQGVIVDTCGGDATSAFTGVRKHLRSNVQAELDTYFVSKLQ